MLPLTAPAPANWLPLEDIAKADQFWTGAAASCTQVTPWLPET